MLWCSSHQNLSKLLHFVYLMYTSFYLFSWTNYPCRLYSSTKDMWHLPKGRCHMSFVEAYGHKKQNCRCYDAILKKNLGKSFHFLYLLFTLSYFFSWTNYPCRVYSCTKDMWHLPKGRCHMSFVQAYGHKEQNCRCYEQFLQKLSQVVSLLVSCIHFSLSFLSWTIFPVQGQVSHVLCTNIESYEIFSNYSLWVEVTVLLKRNKKYFIYAI